MEEKEESVVKGEKKRSQRDAKLIDMVRELLKL